MCGLAGILSLDGEPDLRRPIERMTDSLIHRGPDDSGILIEGPLALGFRRLSILDLEMTGHQPMTSADGSCTIVFNGEIYNFPELRRELEGKGHVFRSTGDTEVLLNAYCEWGRDCLQKLNGMWAFLILDRRRQIVFGSRDRFGIKPLFFHVGDRCVLFASEIKAMCASGFYEKALDWEVVAEFLVRRRLDETDRTFYSGIEQIPAGSFFELGFDGKIQTSRYWSLAGIEPHKSGDPVTAYAELFEDAVRLRMRSDVPIGVFLSGGIDSTSILCSLARVRNSLPAEQQGRLRALAFMDPRFDETQFIDDTIAQTSAELQPVNYDSADIWQDLPKVLWHHDQPVHSTTALIGYRLSQATAEQGIKVILNGQGADETAAGYPSYFQAYWHTVLATGGIGALYGELKQYSTLWGSDPKKDLVSVLRYVLSGQLYRFSSYQKLRSRRDWNKDRQHPWFTSELLGSLGPPEVRQNVRLDLNTELAGAVEQSPLPLYLRIEDRNSMAHSVEVRVPFLDYRLVELLFSLPGQSKMQGPFNKHIVRESMRGRIPDSVRNRHEKMGFPSPAGVWMSELKSNFLDTLNSRRFQELGIFNAGKICQDFARHCDGQIDIGSQVFDVLQFFLWHEMTKNDANSSATPDSISTL